MRSGTGLRYRKVRAVKLCVACGMPMEESADFPLGDRSKEYCVHCARPDGTMQSYDERLAGMASFLLRTQGLAEEAAVAAARGIMAGLPAWREGSD
jgi:hypothetical protein